MDIVPDIADTAEFSPSEEINRIAELIVTASGSLRNAAHRLLDPSLEDYICGLSSGNLDTISRNAETLLRVANELKPCAAFVGLLIEDDQAPF